MKKIHSNFQPQETPQKSFRDYLAAERTDLALENTQLAWIRTVLIFMVAGTAIDKGAEALYTANIVSGKGLLSHANITGIILTIAGTVILTVITFYFILRRRQLLRTKNTYSFGMLPVLLISFFTILIGIGLSYMLITS